MPRFPVLTAILLTLGLVACDTTPQTSQVESLPSPANTSTAQPATPTDRTPANVISVGDGDTLTVSQNGTNVTVRMACVDAPESAASMGQESTARLRDLLPRGTDVTLRPVDTDRYGRTVAEVYVGNNSINLQLVKEGHAVVYRDYLSGCPNQQDFLTAEAQAKDARLAFWSQSDPVMPWDWRKGDRPTAATPPSPQPSPIAPTNNGNCDPSYPGVCIPPAPPDLDCGDISERRFTVRQPDLHRFDGDGNGIGCEGS